MVHRGDTCKTAQDVRVAALKTVSRRMALREKPLPIKPRPLLVKLVERAEVKQVSPPEIIIEKLPEVDPPPYQISIRHIQRAVVRKFDIEMADFLSIRRNPKFSLPRHVSFVLCRILTTRSYPEIARRTGGRDHSTIVHGVQKFQWLVDQLRAELKQTDFLSAWVARAHELVTGQK